jgi:hypothetical protein
MCRRKKHWRHPGDSGVAVRFKNKRLDESLRFRTLSDTKYNGVSRYAQWSISNTTSANPQYDGALTRLYLLPFAHEQILALISYPISYSSAIAIDSLPSMYSCGKLSSATILIDRKAVPPNATLITLPPRPFVFLHVSLLLPCPYFFHFRYESTLFTPLLPRPLQR